MRLPTRVRDRAVVVGGVEDLRLKEDRGDFRRDLENGRDRAADAVREELFTRRDYVVEDGVDGDGRVGDSVRRGDAGVEGEDILVRLVGEGCRRLLHRELHETGGPPERDRRRR